MKCFSILYASALTMSRQVVTSRFRPYLLSEADTLDVVTQSVSISSISLAWYVYTLDDSTNEQEEQGKAVATVLFTALNAGLLCFHLYIIAIPFWRSLRSAVITTTASLDSVLDDHDDAAADVECNNRVKPDNRDVALALNPITPRTELHQVYSLDSVLDDQDEAPADVECNNRGKLDNRDVTLVMETPRTELHQVFEP